jgi:BirA family biotin operon repressor/biotin-[acetyl-CoA-carboxylase] ligase
VSGEVVIQRVDSAPSTMDVVHRLAQGGAPAGTTVIAAEQTGGRGSRGRDWASPRGGLWLSGLLRPGAAVALEVLSVRAALVTAAAVERVVPGLQLRVKWPNDLLLGDRKAGGILCEARWQGGSLGWVCVGVGINVTNSVPPGLERVAVALVSQAPGTTVEQLAEPVARAIADLGACTGPLTGPELADLEGRDALRCRRVAEPIPGTAEAIRPDGMLTIRGVDGTLTAIRSGPVRLAGPS